MATMFMCAKSKTMFEEMGLVLLLTLFGFMLILLDILFLPGSVLVALGVTTIFYSIYINYQSFGGSSAGIQFVLCLGAAPFLVTWALGRISLKLELKAEDGYVGLPTDRQQYVGVDAVAQSDLRPSGSIVFKHNDEEKYLDCVSDGVYIEKGSKVKVIEIRGPSVVVQKI
jgi:membrane-bound serine protease (ClpP class)